MTASRGPRIARVFVDSSAFFALADQDDNHYGDAQAIQQRLIADRSAWFTSNFIVAEAHALFLTRLGIRPAMQFLDRLELSSVTVIRVTPGDEARAKAIVRQYDDKDFSLTDASSFAIMERTGMQHAFTFDRHFEQFGLSVLP